MEIFANYAVRYTLRSDSSNQTSTCSPANRKRLPRWKSQEPDNFWKSLNEMRCVRWLEEILVRGVFACPYVPSIRLTDGWMQQSVNGSLTERLKGQTEFSSRVDKE